MSDEAPNLIETRDEGVLVLTLNRPDRLNAMDGALMRTLNEAVRKAAGDAEVGCVVLTGAGGAFSSGGDMKAAAKARGEGVAPAEHRPQPNFEARVAWLKRSMEAARLLHDMPKPTIAMISGACAGAGMSLAGACDLRFAGETARFTTAFARAGLSGDYGGSWFWTRILGTAKARELYLLAEKFDAQQALAAGVVSAVYPEDELTGKVMEVARRLANGPRAAYGYMKRNLNAAETGRMDEVFDLEAMTMLLSRAALTAAKASQ
jgi:2-(1,2-epoxy-1,2-dihydrophenyl)acetyl-CoA isomerase